MATKPILLHYYITNRCNARCRFCTIWSENPKKDATLRDVTKNLTISKSAGCKFVDFTGGEPLLHPDLPQFLTIAQKKGFITSVTTNCILFPERVKELKGKIDLLHFSLDADTESLHNEIRGCNSYVKVLESIEAARCHDLVPDILFTYTDYNIDAFEGVYALARKKRLTVILDPVFRLQGCDTVAVSTHEKALRFARKPGIYLNRAHLTLRNMGGNHIREPYCRAVTSTIVISPDNKRLLPCFHHHCETVPADESMTNAITPVLAKALAKQGTYSFCEGCHINCYFDPSYNYRYNRLFFQSLKSKLVYISMKYLIYGHFKAFLRLKRAL